LILGLVLAGVLGVFDQRPQLQSQTILGTSQEGGSNSPAGAAVSRRDENPAKAIPGILLIASLVLFLYPRRLEPRTLGTAWALWLLGGLGCLGLQRFYCRKYGSAIAFLLTAGVFLVGGILDAFKMNRLVYEANLSSEEREQLASLRLQQQAEAQEKGDSNFARNLKLGLGVGLAWHLADKQREATKEQTEAIQEQTKELKRQGRKK
jgi:hypothetical protein